MAQSVKRALKVDPNHPQLHSCLIRLHHFLTKGDLLNENISHPAVASVLKSETQPLFRHHQEAEQLNKEFLEENANSLPHLLQGKNRERSSWSFRWGDSRRSFRKGFYLRIVLFTRRICIYGWMVYWQAPKWCVFSIGPARKKPFRLLRGWRKLTKA